MPVACRTALMLSMHHMVADRRPSDIGYRDSETRPVRCHWAYPDDESKCDTVLEAAERSWQIEVEQEGFNEPIPDDDGLLDIYIDDDQTYGGAWTWGPLVDQVPDDGRMGTYAYIVIDPAIPDGQLPVYVAHEFNHVLQYATDFTEPTLPIWEGNATYAEAWVYPDVGVDQSYVRDFQRTPWVGLLGDGYKLWNQYQIWSEYEYGALIWIAHLDAYWGDGQGSGGALLWRETAQEGWTNEPDVLDAYDTVTTDQVSALMDLSIQRTRIGTDSPPDWAPFTRATEAVGVVDSVNAGALPLVVTADPGPMQTGVVYVKVTGLSAGQTLRFTVTDTEDVGWAVLAAEPDDGDWVEGTTMDWTMVGDSVYFGAVNLGGSDFDADQTLKTTTPTLTVELVDPGDTGGTGTGDTQGGDGGHASDAKGGCGCGGSAPVGGAWALAAVSLLVIGRRRPA